MFQSSSKRFKAEWHYQSVLEKNKEIIWSSVRNEYLQVAINYSWSKRGEFSYERKFNIINNTSIESEDGIYKIYIRKVFLNGDIVIVEGVFI